MFVQNLNKITLSLSINPSIMENIKEKKISNHVHFKKFWYLFMLNDITYQHYGIFFCLQNKNFKFIKIL
jgi:hypothetical protein